MEVVGREFSCLSPPEVRAEVGSAACRPEEKGDKAGHACPASKALLGAACLSFSPAARGHSHKKKWWQVC